MQGTIEQNWREILKNEFTCDYFIKLMQFLEQEINKNQVYPPTDQIFTAFNKTPYGKVKVVIIGQDPYHGEGQAHGLCFSVADGIKPPPSLVNIYKELKNDLGLSIPTTGDLSYWAEQGVLLLNTTLTVKAQNAGSHQKRGWETFTDAVIRIISEKKEGLVFILWGKHAQSKEALIDPGKHYVLKAAHPSPLSAYNGFWGCKHFSKTNEFLKKSGLKEIDWRISYNSSN
ncbi:MAG: uracil-DNA glycosylase [Bacteroidota bacterium]|nr:uracil-DNA glycosylase [Bacteroidota bacterium]